MGLAAEQVEAGRQAAGGQRPAVTPPTPSIFRCILTIRLTIKYLPPLLACFSVSLTPLAFSAVLSRQLCHFFF